MPPFSRARKRSGQPGRRGRAAAEWLADYPNIQYRQVILGFVVEPGGSRWLTHQEISTGVMAAVRRDAPYYVVGTVEPCRSGLSIGKYWW